MSKVLSAISRSREFARRSAVEDSIHMSRVTSRTQLTELKSRVGSTDKCRKDGPAGLLRSVPQSLRAKGDEVREEVLR